MKESNLNNSGTTSYTFCLEVQLFQYVCFHLKRTFDYRVRVSLRTGLESMMYNYGMEFEAVTCLLIYATICLLVFTAKISNLLYAVPQSFRVVKFHAPHCQVVVQTTKRLYRTLNRLRSFIVVSHDLLNLGSLVVVTSGQLLLYCIVWNCKNRSKWSYWLFFYYLFSHEIILQWAMGIWKSIYIC